MFRLSAISLLFAFLCFPGSCFAQLDAGPNDTINPGVPVNLTATYGEIATGVTIQDDAVKGPFPIGFSFHFFGVSYDIFYIGANGWISFTPNPNAAGIREAFAVPSAAPFNPKNCILCPFQDFKPDSLSPLNPFIYYLTIGDTPNRQLVVMWCETPMYHCPDSLVTFQVVLNETSNVIENHISMKPICIDWFGNHATLGVQNANGFTGFAVPGRNATSWRAFHEGWQYTPTTADSFAIISIPYKLRSITPGSKIQYSWYQGSDFIANGQEITVSPKKTTTYIASVNLCDGEVFKDSVKVVVVPYIPNAFTPNGDGKNDSFRILGLPPENITNFNFQIYDRWGQLIFNTSNILDAWDGTSKGISCPPGVYIWIIYYMDKNKAKISNKGTVTLVK
ncbi:MAG: gliding motility-associated C-terminal domain-containing protein [Bacteroidetes bacterium]|nr:gliding motility-associated C-terminal domain-containing protein [Bacteroidota bacterium]